MKFCAQCGKTMAILTGDGDNLCPQCAGTSRTTAQAPAAELDGDLRQSSLSVKDGRLQLLSREGWLLWSGSVHQSHSLEQIATRASRILKIRKRRTK